MIKCITCQDTGLISESNYPYTQTPCGFCATVFSGKEMKVIVEYLHILAGYMKEESGLVCRITDLGPKPSTFTDEEWKHFNKKLT